MAKKQQPLPVVGDTYAIPLEKGRYSACRVLKMKDTGQMLVVNSAWTGDHVPSTNDSTLRPILKLTHHSWGGKVSAAWVSGPPPKEFTAIGNIPPHHGEDSFENPGTGGWSFFRTQPLEQWRWDHPEDIPVRDPHPPGHFILHRFNGDEVYRFKSAIMWAYETEKGVTLWFEIEADPEQAQRYEDTAGMGMSPNAEVGIDLPELNADQLIGRTFSIPGTNSDDEDSRMSLLYYCEHEPLRQNEITVLSRVDDRFRLRWTGVSMDVNYYDGSKPLTKVEIEGEFQFKDIGKWVDD